MMATTMRMKMMTTKVETTMMALKKISRRKAAQAKREERAGVHQQASRLLQWAQPSSLRLPHHRFLHTLWTIQQKPSLVLGHLPPYKVQFQ